MDKIELPLSYCWLFLIQEKKEEFTFFREGSLEMCRVKEGKTIHPILRDAILLLTIPLKHYFPIEHPTSPSLLEISNFWRNTAGRGGTPPWARTIFNLLSIQPVGRRTTFKLPLNSNLQWPRHSPSDGNLNLIFLRCKSPDPNWTCPAVKSHGIFWEYRSILNSNHF